jgi:glycosyltransferase involved in cell wall biosynthesis
MKTYRIGFLMVQSLGHVTHYQRMRLEVAKDAEIQPVWMPIFPYHEDHWQRFPMITNNNTLKYGLRARDQLQDHKQSFDALYCHTQETAVLLGKYMKRIPTILSLDATPINFASVGPGYDRRKRSKAVERVKHFLIKKSFERAAHLVPWSHWVKDSLINDYGMPEQKITMNTPGLDLDLWNVANGERAYSHEDLLPRILFVGGQFRRKGGEALVQSAATMQGGWEVDIVTQEKFDGAERVPNLRVHRDLRTDTPELLALYRKANIFVLPTLADCFGLAIMEAMAMRLPVITTRVGGISELVIHGETGLFIPPNSPEALMGAIRELGKDPERRRAMGDAGRRRVEQYFDGSRSYRELVGLIKSIVYSR